MAIDAQQFKQAARLSQGGKHADAGKIYRQILRRHPANATAWHSLAIAEHQQGNLAAALECIGRAIELESGQAPYHMLKGNVLQDQGKLEEAEASFLVALQISPDFAQAFNNLGIVLRDQQKSDRAIEAFRRAIERDPAYFKAYNNLGSALQSSGQTDDAIDCYRRAIELKPDYFIALHNLATAYFAQGNYLDADACFRQAIGHKPDYFPSYLAYGRMLLAQQRLAEAESCLQQAVQIGPRDVAAHNLLAEALAMGGKTVPALAAYRQAQALEPSNIKAALGLALTLPQVYQDRTIIDEVRADFESGLRTLEERVELFRRNPADKVLADILWNNFNLAYQGRNDKELQLRFSGFIEKILVRTMPLYMQPLAKKNCTGRRIRVGFLSSFFYQCTAGKYFSSWITHLDKSRFETFVYHTNSVADDITRNVEAATDHFKSLPKSLSAIAGEVRGDDLDVLVFPEIGMNGKTHILSALRLAPVQCAGWGHPVTSGHANMDYYFSSALMEPEEAQDHYTERLLLLPEIGTSYPRNSIPIPASRADFGLPEDKTLYLCPQSLFKIHPDNDALFLRVLEGDEQGVLVFFSARHEATTHAFISRLVREFAAHGLDKAGRVKILPILGHEDYLRVNLLCDVMLDTLYWSGGNTSLDALSCGLPLATLPGEFMRGRQSSGMLQAMGITELTARDEDDFVRIAILLGKNPAYRKEISARILDNAGQVFEDEAPIRALERHLVDITAVSPMSVARHDASTAHSA